MGGFFSGAIETPPPPPPAIAPDSSEADKKARQDIQDRNRRGRAGLIATTETGADHPTLGAGRSLLGGGQ